MAGHARPFVFRSLFCLHGADRAGARGNETFACEFIGALVLRVAGMTFDPVPMHLVVAERLVETLPEIDIFYRFFIRGAPSVFLPAVDPHGNAVLEIFTVRVKVDGTWPFERFQGGNRGHQFHAIVGGVRFTAFEFLFVIAENEDGTPTAGARIAGACAVSVYGDALL